MGFDDQDGHRIALEEPKDARAQEFLYKNWVRGRRNLERKNMHGNAFASHSIVSV